MACHAARRNGGDHGCMDADTMPELASSSSSLQAVPRPPVVAQLMQSEQLDGEMLWDIDDDANLSFEAAHVAEASPKREASEAEMRSG